MIERVVLHQNRFRTPGLQPDPRGVALGPLGLVLLASAERLVNFLRAAGEEGALDEMLDSMRILQVITPLRTREIVVEVSSASSHRMDRVAAIGRLVGGMVFSGSGRHFVKYRDLQAPFGYDVAELLADPGDLALYHDRFAQAYRLDRTIAVRDLVLRLAPVSAPAMRPEGARTVYVLVPIGLGESVIGYLARWTVPARVARVEWQRGGTSDVLERAYLLVLTSPAPRFVHLLRSIPGIRLFLPDGEAAAVEVGHRHPIPLSACAPLFGSRELMLFRAGGAGAIALADRPPFVDVGTLLALPAQSVAPLRGTAISPTNTFALNLSLVPSSSPPKRVSASVIPNRELHIFARIVCALPPSALGRMTCAFTEHALFLYAPDAASAIPLGTLYEEIGAGVFVPLGHSLSPPVPPDVLRRLANVGDTQRLFVTGGKYPVSTIPTDAFVPVSKLLLSEIGILGETVISAPLDGERALPNLWPEPPGLFAALTSPGAQRTRPVAELTASATETTNAAPEGGESGQ